MVKTMQIAGLAIAVSAASMFTAILSPRLRQAATWTWVLSSGVAGAACLSMVWPRKVQQQDLRNEAVVVPPAQLQEFEVLMVSKSGASLLAVSGGTWRSQEETQAIVSQVSDLYGIPWTNKLLTPTLVRFLKNEGVYVLMVQRWYTGTGSATECKPEFFIPT